MSLGTSLILVALGAILAFAVDIHATIASTTVHWHTVGWILMIVGVLGLLLSMIWMLNSRRQVRTTADGDYVERRPV
jgi:uncharacterized membrane protein HdeD (DUF308 family)